MPSSESCTTPGLPRPRATDASSTHSTLWGGGGGRARLLEELLEKELELRTSDLNGKLF